MLKFSKFFLRKVSVRMSSAGPDRFETRFWEKHNKFRANKVPLALNVRSIELNIFFVASG